MADATSAPEALEEQLLLGLEQAQDTLMPEIHLRKRFKPFVEDELGEIVKGSPGTGGPSDYQRCPARSTACQPVTLAIGPEGGFIPYEVRNCKSSGFESVHLGPRILQG